jgi:hypothetical protein
MTPIQQLLLGVGASKKTYLDDVFSNYLYKGTGSAQSINNQIDMSEGGLTWIKNRASQRHALVDTARGAGKMLASDENWASTAADLSSLSSFNSNGFSLGNESGGFQRVNMNNNNYSSWTFRKAKGFFDCVTWTGNSDTNQTISHSLGSIPGMIIAKRTDSSTTGNWVVYHKDYSGYVVLNSSNGGASSSDWQDITSTSFRAYDYINVNGASYVAYVFAGGESDAATARSVDFDGSGDYVKFEAASSGIAVGTGNFTCEFWVKLNADVTGNDALIDTRHVTNDNGFQIYLGSNRAVYGYVNGDMFGATTKILNVGTWHHIAVVRSSSTATKLYVDGTKVGNTYTTNDNHSNSEMVVGANSSGGTESNVKISNLRLTKGQALYTSSFRPPTEPLTTTSQGATASNVKILAFNNSSVTGGTVVPATVNSSGDPTASTDSPFDDPAGFVFGDSKEGIIKCGSYEGNNADDGTEVFLGYEPSLLLIKSADTADNWCIFDNLRGMTVDGLNDQALFPNASDAEAAGGYLTPTSTGFKLTTQSDRVNNNSTYIYMAIRRSDGYVGKPAEAGTDAFNVVYGNSSSTIPNFPSNFPVDMGIYKEPSNTYSWYLHTRLTGGKNLKTDSTDGNQAGSDGDATFDSNAGWGKFGYNTDKASWLWKRHAGFDVVTYEGTQTVQDIRHSMNKSPEMMWIKNRDSATYNWSVYHSGLGDNRFKLYLNTDNDYSNDQAAWNNTAPTSTHFTLGTDATANHNGSSYIAMLFSSVNGISKVGSYTGNGVKTGNVQTLGFQPRFILIKCADTASTNWWVFDTTNGISAGNENFLSLNTTNSTSSGDWIDLTSDGFDVVEDISSINGNTKNYIYYAHA